MKFRIERLEDRIAPTHGPVQQAILAGGGGKSKAGPFLIEAQQALSGFGGPVQQAILAGGGGKSKAGPFLIMAQQQLPW
jgi:hypothetical protein